MSAASANSHRRLLIVLFLLFEGLFAGSVLAAWCLELRRRSPVDDVVGITLVYALIGLLVVSFLLRRIARRWARIAWGTLLIGLFALELLLAVP